VPQDALAHWREATAQCAQSHDEWKTKWQAYKTAHPELAAELERRMNKELPAQLEQAFPAFDAKSGNVASRAASGVVINAIANVVPELFGGSADLTGSNLTNVKGAHPFSASQRDGRNIHFGIREHAMGAIMNGMGLHGGVIPYGGTFLVFSDYMRPAIRLAGLMGVQAIYVFTHDSIGLGEDGPTHQPVEHLTALRCIPNLLVLRPSDADEVSEAWRTALHHKSGPSAIVLTRQKLSYFAEPARAKAGVKQGAYIVADAAGQVPNVVLLASGSEVEIALKAREQLSGHGIHARVVSCPSLELFAQQPIEYRNHVLPAGVPRVAVEAAHPMSWYRWVGDTGAIVGIETFGASAPAPVLYEKFGITAEKVAAAAKSVIR
jgi:transketolase